MLPFMEGIILYTIAVFLDAAMRYTCRVVYRYTLPIIGTQRITLNTEDNCTCNAPSAQLVCYKKK